MADNEKRDGRLPKQLGDFGESFVIFVLGNLKKCRVALVDHEGADIIAYDSLTKERYAISVKTRWFKKDDASEVFNKDNQDKLKRFAEEFALTPMVAYVLLNKEADVLDVYLVKLSDFERLAKDKTFKAMSVRDVDGFAILNTTETNKQFLQNSDSIDHTQLKFSAFQDKISIMI